MDISGLGVVAAASRGSDMPLLNPFTAEPTGIVLRVLGFDSEEVVSAGRQYSSVNLLKKNRANIEEVGLKRMVAQAKAAVIGLGENSEPFMFGAEPMKIPSPEFHQLLENKDFQWIANQVQRWGDDRGNYSPEVSTA